MGDQDQFDDDDQDQFDDEQDQDQFDDEQDQDQFDDDEQDQDQFDDDEQDQFDDEQDQDQFDDDDQDQFDDEQDHDQFDDHEQDQDQFDDDEQDQDSLTSLFDDDYSDSEESQDHDCPNNQVWNECGTACPLQCGEDRPEWCTYNCVIGCACPDNMWMTNDGNCVAEQDCPEQNQYHPCDFETPVCQNNGQCMRNGDDYYCDCFAPWSGQHCDVISDPMSAVSVVNIMQ